KIIAPSASHHALISSKAPTKNVPTASSANCIFVFISSNLRLILAVVSQIVSIVSSLRPIERSKSMPPSVSPLKNAVTPEIASITLSLNSIADSQAPINLSLSPSMKFLNVSDLLYANTNPAPSATIAAIVKVIVLVSAPNIVANHLSRPPALVMEAINVASALTTHETNVIILLTTINTGPAAAATTPSHFCQPAIGKLSHISPSTRVILSENVPTELQRLLNRFSMSAPS